MSDRTPAVNIADAVESGPLVHFTIMWREGTYELRHRSSDLSLTVSASDFHDRYREASQAATGWPPDDPRHVPAALQVMETMLPPLCQMCGNLVGDAVVCTPCAEIQVTELTALRKRLG